MQSLAPGQAPGTGRVPAVGSDAAVTLLSLRNTQLTTNSHNSLALRFPWLLVGLGRTSGEVGAFLHSMPSSGSALCSPVRWVSLQSLFLAPAAALDYLPGGW